MSKGVKSARFETSMPTRAWAWHQAFRKYIKDQNAFTLRRDAATENRKIKTSGQNAKSVRCKRGVSGILFGARFLGCARNDHPPPAKRRAGKLWCGKSHPAHSHSTSLRPGVAGLNGIHNQTHREPVEEYGVQWVQSRSARRVRRIFERDEGRRENTEDRGQMAEGRWQRAEGRWQRAEGRGQMAEGRWQRAEGMERTGYEGRQKWKSKTKHQKAK